MVVWRGRAWMVRSTKSNPTKPSLLSYIIVAKPMCFVREILLKKKIISAHLLVSSCCWALQKPLSTTTKILMQAHNSCLVSPRPFLLLSSFLSIETVGGDKLLTLYLDREILDLNGFLFLFLNLISSYFPKKLWI